MIPRFYLQSLQFHQPGVTLNTWKSGVLGLHRGAPSGPRPISPEPPFLFGQELTTENSTLQTFAGPTAQWAAVEM